MSHKQTAQAIIEKFATYQTDKVEAAEADAKPEKMIRASLIGVLGYNLTGVAKDKDEAAAQLVKRVSSDLESGSLILSDTWADDNLNLKK